MADALGPSQLPRGGLHVPTSAGPVQFGVPPETIKDSMALGLEVPTLYVVPRERFDRFRGLNVAECEFPAYYNYFVLKRRIRLLVEDAAAEAAVRTVFQESLFGPASSPRADEFADEIAESARPDFVRESDYFRRGPTGTRIEVDDLIEFLRFDAGGVAPVGPGVEIARVDGGYEVRDGGQVIARAPARIDLPERSTLSTAPPSPFEPPAFGITVLGSSHGFDPKGKTTGFILWLDRRGLLIDPPVDATEHLRANGVAPKLIEGVILTHCHADHDSGTFQKILEEGRITLYTTPTILGSFLKKYSALSGLSEILLRRTFVFHPVKIGAPTRVLGAELRFFYTLHSIPTAGFEVFYGGRSLVFSADTLYDPPRVQAMRDAGVLSEPRARQLLDFPWHHTVVLHEAGVPPLHTPTSALAALPGDIKERLFLVHIAEKDLPPGQGLKVAQIGLENTISIDVIPSPHAEAIDVLNAFCAVDLFRDFPLSRARELLHVARRVSVPRGEKIIDRGSPGDAFYVIVSGIVSVIQDGNFHRKYQAGDYFGETALLLDRPRNADVVAETDASLLRIARYDFLYLLRGTDLAARLVRLARMRAERSWEVIERNSVLRELTSGQKTLLQSSLGSREIRPGDVLWRAGDEPAEAFLIEEGAVTIDGDGASQTTTTAPRAGSGPAARTRPGNNDVGHEPFRSGAFIGEFDALRQGRLATGGPGGSGPASSSHVAATTARVVEPGRVFFVGARDLARFFQENPGVLLSFLESRFVE